MNGLNRDTISISKIDNPNPSFFDRSIRRSKWTSNETTFAVRPFHILGFARRAEERRGMRREAQGIRHRGGSIVHLLCESGTPALNALTLKRHRGGKTTKREPPRDVTLTVKWNNMAGALFTSGGGGRGRAGLRGVFGRAHTLSAGTALEAIALRCRLRRRRLAETGLSSLRRRRPEARAVHFSGWTRGAGVPQAAGADANGGGRRLRVRPAENRVRLSRRQRPTSRHVHARHRSPYTAAPPLRPPPSPLSALAARTAANSPDGFALYLFLHIFIFFAFEYG